MSLEARIAREKRRDYERHWTAERSQRAHAGAFAKAVTRKSAKRTVKRARMVAKYRDFLTAIKAAGHFEATWAALTQRPNGLRRARDTVLARTRGEQP